MLLYRIGKARYAKDLTGEGSKIYGGRWNHEGIPCIYTTENRALSLLEYSAHVSLDSIPRALSFTTFQVPVDSIKTFSLSDLPGNWNSWPHLKESRDFGSKWLKQNRFLIFRSPSAVIQQEYNYVINVLHERIKEVKIVEAVDYSYDLRIKN